MALKTCSGADAVDTDASFLLSLLPPSSQWSCLISLRVLSLQVRLALEKCRHDLQVLRYDNTKLAFHCQACDVSAASDQTKVNSAKRSSAFSEGGMGVENESCVTNNINRIASQLRLKPMASLMADSTPNCTSEALLLDEGDVKEPQEKSEDPVSPPRTAIMPISKRMSHFPPTSSSSLSSAAGGTFHPSSRHGSLQPLAAGLQSPLYSNPLFNSQVPRILDPAPRTTSIGPGFPPC